MAGSLMLESAAARGVGVIAVLCAVGIPFILSVPVVASFLMKQVQVCPPVTQAELAAAASGPPCAILILSAGRRAFAPEFGGATVDAYSLERLRYGALLVRQTGLPVLVSGSGRRIREPPLAQLMADALSADYGV